MTQADIQECFEILHRHAIFPVGEKTSESLS